MNTVWRVAFGFRIPAARLRGEDGALTPRARISGLPSRVVYGIMAAFHQVGEFPDANGAGADFTLVVQVAYSYGVTFLPEVIGRYRVGPQQATDYSIPERAEAILDLFNQNGANDAEPRRFRPRSPTSLLDYMTWWIFRIIAGSMMESHPFFVSRLCRKCLLVTPSEGAWRRRVRSEYPFRFGGRNGLPCSSSRRGCGYRSR